VHQAGHSAQRRATLRELTPRKRRRLFIETDDGLAPAMLWLGEDGMPLTVSAWKSVFSTANDRCVAHDVVLACHPHLLRHSYAVITLEQLQRGHLPTWPR
jgi:site-specific recombinase XerD